MHESGHVFEDDGNWVVFRRIADRGFQRHAGLAVAGGGALPELAPSVVENRNGFTRKANDPEEYLLDLAQLIPRGLQIDCLLRTHLLHQSKQRGVVGEVNFQPPLLVWLALDSESLTDAGAAEEIGDVFHGHHRGVRSGTAGGYLKAVEALVRPKLGEREQHSVNSMVIAALYPGEELAIDPPLETLMWVACCDRSRSRC